MLSFKGGGDSLWGGAPFFSVLDAIIASLHGICGIMARLGIHGICAVRDPCQGDPLVPRAGVSGRPPCGRSWSWRRSSTAARNERHGSSVALVATRRVALRCRAGTTTQSAWTLDQTLSMLAFVPFDCGKDRFRHAVNEIRSIAVHRCTQRATRLEHESIAHTSTGTHRHKCSQTSCTQPVTFTQRGSRQSSSPCTAPCWWRHDRFSPPSPPAYWCRDSAVDVCAC